MKIAVASCVKLQQTNPQPVWKEILDEKPDVLLLLGDTVYLEHNHHVDAQELRTELRSRYDEQMNEPHFKALLDDVRARGAKLLAIYDDHDFLGNNRYGGDGPPALREAAREELVRAFGLPTLDSGDVYQQFRSGPTEIFLLDERYYRNSPASSSTDRDAILGARQWQWLEDAFKASNSPFIVVASSTTFHRFGDESWEQYSAAFDRMRALMQDRPGAMIVSGDVHRNDLYDDSGVLEVVTSAVARRGLLFGAPRKNYCILTYTDSAVQVDLRGLKSGDRFNLAISRANWSLGATVDAADSNPPLWAVQ